MHLGSDTGSACAPGERTSRAAERRCAGARRLTVAIFAVFLGVVGVALFGADASAQAANAASGEVHAAEPTASPAAAHPLVWEAMEKRLTPKPGETSAAFEFRVHNVSDQPVTIEQVRPTCGCTVVEMPNSPWMLAPGGHGSFFGTIEFAGKSGTLTKAIFVTSTPGIQRLSVVVAIPTLDREERRRNQRIALTDRQAVFRGECASCHAAPAAGLTGTELFVAACGVCHLAGQRASMVPDLLVARQHRDAAYWRTWITQGKEGTLMPAWSAERGGPLSPAQIDSLVEFALRTLPTEPRPSEMRSGAP